MMNCRSDARCSKGGNEPNKAPEPTRTAVMPRAIADSVSHADLAGARATPAVRVAHL